MLDQIEVSIIVRCQIFPENQRYNESAQDITRLCVPHIPLVV